jgi:hypothetical protein
LAYAPPPDDPFEAPCGRLDGESAMRLGLGMPLRPNLGKQENCENADGIGIA